MKPLMQDANKEDGDAAKSTTGQDADAATLIRVRTYINLDTQFPLLAHKPDPGVCRQYHILACLIHVAE